MAWVGQTGTQKPHPVHAESTTEGCLRLSMATASQLQAILQLTQTTPSHARHCSRDSEARPTGIGRPAGAGPATGQTLKQSPQKVQPALEKDR